MGVLFDTSFHLHVTIFWCLLDFWFYFSSSTGTGTALSTALLIQRGWEEPTDGLDSESFFPDLSWGSLADRFDLTTCKSIHLMAQSFLSRREYRWQFLKGKLCGVSGWSKSKNEGKEEQWVRYGMATLSNNGHCDCVYPLSFITDSCWILWCISVGITISDWLGYREW